jgi:NAD+ kinase
MSGTGRIAFRSNGTPVAEAAKAALVARHGTAPEAEAEVIVALGGDGFMLETLHGTMHLDLPVYGMNCGTIGFLMNEYALDGLPERVAAAVEEVINPLAMRATRADGSVHEALAINEVSLLRQGPQAAKLRISVDGKVGWRNWSATARSSRRPQDPRPTTTRPTGRSCRSGRTSSR